MMRLRPDKGEDIIEINRELYRLSCCVNCGAINASLLDDNAFKLIRMDEKIPCCKNPDNMFYGEFSIINIKIEEFKQKWF